MNPIHRLLIKLRLLPITSDDLTALLDRADNQQLSARSRLPALVEYAVMTMTEKQLVVVIAEVKEAILKQQRG